ncbi:hypothetical protein EYC84_011150 [Monilinia fructicola]|uniref:Uncharacterized protein n=1 Tax=Monilinia fructicola TaxID=38448 RepID=A0A5M9J4N8_MONFR|nr:hypothetical protein EYC84_011150 [Monilinia fructicola]
MISKIYSDDSEEYLFPGLEVLQQPSIADSILPPVYSRRVLIFSNDDSTIQDDNRKQAVQVLRDALQTTIEQYPVLANGLSRSSGLGLLQDPSEFHQRRALAMRFDTPPRDGRCEYHKKSYKIWPGTPLSKHRHKLRGVAAAFDRSRLSISSAVPDISKMPAYMILSESFDFSTRTAGSIASTMYRFTNESLARLKSDSALFLPPDCPWISTHDAITLGNAVIFTATSFITVSDLVGPEGLSLAGAAVRRAIRCVDADYIDNSIAVMRDIPASQSLMYYGALYGKTTGITSTTYKSFTMPDTWHSAIGKYELMRLTHGAFGDGMFVIMPVRETGWEVIVTLDETAMEAFEDEEWKRYAVKLDV